MWRADHSFQPFIASTDIFFVVVVTYVFIVTYYLLVLEVLPYKMVIKDIDDTVL